MWKALGFWAPFGCITRKRRKNAGIWGNHPPRMWAHHHQLWSSVIVDQIPWPSSAPLLHALREGSKTYELKSKAASLPGWFRTPAKACMDRFSCRNRSGGWRGWAFECASPATFTSLPERPDEVSWSVNSRFSPTIRFSAARFFLFTMMPALPSRGSKSPAIVMCIILIFSVKAWALEAIAIGGTHERYWGVDPRWDKPTKLNWCT